MPSYGPEDVPAGMRPAMLVQSRHSCFLQLRCNRKVISHIEHGGNKRLKMPTDGASQWLGQFRRRLSGVLGRIMTGGAQFFRSSLMLVRRAA